MKKWLIWTTVVLFVFSMTLVGIGCKTESAATTAAETTAAETTAAETTAAETTTAAATEKLNFEQLLEIAKKRAVWPEALGADLKVGWAQNNTFLPFCVTLEEGFIQQLKWSGVKAENIFSVNNEADPKKALENGDILISKKPDIIVSYQFYANINEILAKKYKEAGIPVGAAVDIPMTGAPTVGIDNFGGSYAMGEFVADKLEEKWGSIDNVDLIILCSIQDAGPELMKRTYGAQEALTQRYGADALKGKIEIPNTFGSIDKAKEEISRILAAHPEAKNIVITHQNTENSIGGRQAFEEANIPRENYISTCIGDNIQGLEVVKDGTVEMGFIDFPQVYGDYMIASMYGVLNGVLVPSSIIVPAVTATIDNVDAIISEMNKALGGEGNPNDVIEKYIAK